MSYLILMFTELWNPCEEQGNQISLSLNQFSVLTFHKRIIKSIDSWSSWKLTYYQVFTIKKSTYNITFSVVTKI